MRTFYASENPNGWTPVGAEQMLGRGYEIAWQIPDSEQFAIWISDANGNYVSTIVAGEGTSIGIEQAESVLHQDLNGAGVIGLVTTVIEAAIVRDDFQPGPQRRRRYRSGNATSNRACSHIAE